jgi:hypothetical protein
MVHGVGTTLYKEKKSIWPPFPLWVWLYSFEYVKQAQAEVDTLTSFYFREKILWRNDPLDVVKKYYLRHKH